MSHDINTALKVLEEFWGYTQFRDGQEAVIEATMKGNDVIALLPTGGGKSICFQVPAMMLEGITLVVSPLIALMNDQVASLHKKDIPAVAIHSGLGWKAVDRELDNASAGKYKLVYVSPERLVSGSFRERLKHMDIALLVIDEAHCISQWGYDFRPPYLQIAGIREFLTNVPVLALTATATQKVRSDIATYLGMEDPVEIRQSFKRENMHLIVRNEEDKWSKLLESLNRVNGTAIVYVRNRKGTRELARFLQRKGISADYYHAGRTTEERLDVQTNWLSDKTRVAVCTNAFGMGIDKPDVRLVMHWDLPDSPEAYFQEAGRGGRDGKPCYAGLLFNEKDIENLESFFETQYPPLETVRKVYHKLTNFFQIASGSGEGQTFPMDLNAFVKYSGELPLVCVNSLRVLQQQGFLYMNDSAQRQSQVRVVTSHEDLYRYQIENPRLEPLVKGLLRTCPGLFEEDVHLREKQLAYLLSTPVNDIIRDLHRLHEAGVIEYREATDDMRITFVKECFPSGELPLDVKLLKEIRKEARRRMDAMIGYVKDKPSCRMRKLMLYFGEEVADCGQCDYCVERDRMSISEERLNASYNWLQQRLNDKPMDITELMKEKLPLKKEQFLEVVSYFADNKVIRYNELNELEWIA